MRECGSAGVHRCERGGRRVIPRAEVLEWRQNHPWQDDAQVEQDLLLTRALIELFSHDDLRERLAFRGGTALHKLYLKPPQRYSEDIDLVQIDAGPIGPINDGVQQALNPWLGTPTRKRGPGVANLVYRTESTGPVVLPRQVKISLCPAATSSPSTMFSARNPLICPMS